MYSTVSYIQFQKSYFFDSRVSDYIYIYIYPLQNLITFCTKNTVKFSKHSRFLESYKVANPLPIL